jgi:hypothetical protein
LDTKAERRSWTGHNLKSMCALCGGGANTVVLELTGCKVSVSAFSPIQDAMPDIPFRTIAWAYGSEVDGNTCLLVYHKTMVSKDQMLASLINPNQVRTHGHKIQDCSKQSDPTSDHSIRIQ